MAVQPVLLLASLIPCVWPYMGPMMGVQTQCDDGKTHLEVDWDTADFSTFTCMNKASYTVNKVDTVFYDLKSSNASFDPTKDVVYHRCMTETIEYDESPPIRGDHRPNWARYGEYLYVPEQRWLHNLEHGSIIFLYHPCANETEVDKLRSIVTRCLYRHIITPYKKLSEIRPLALVAWGARMEMGFVDEMNVISFIKKHARIAPEDIFKDGIYDQYLVKPAAIVSDEKDSNLCPLH